MKPNFPILMAATALALVACSKKDDTATADSNVIDMNMPMDNGTMDNTAATAPSPTTAQGFVNAAAASDKFEIESSKLAATAASSAAVKNFAQQMVTAHTASTEKLKSTLSGVTPPVTPDNTLTPEQQATLDSLKGLTRTAFDSAYASAQAEAHQKMLDTLNAYAASGDSEQLKAFANGLIPTVTAHLNLAKGLK